MPQKFVCDDGFRLGVWLSNLRTKYRTGKLKPDRIEQLENIGMIWNKETLHFETEIAHAKAYLEKFGNLDIPKDYVCENGYRLGVWLRTVRSSYNSGQLSKRRIQELEKLGIVWNPLKEAWDRGYAHAKEYYATHDGGVAPAKYVCEDGYKLGQWIRRQMKRLKDGKIDSETKRLLSNIGIE